VVSNGSETRRDRPLIRLTTYLAKSAALVWEAEDGTETKNVLIPTVQP
jgi:hypothetical protein